jgi:hypothetical protein
MARIRAKTSHTNLELAVFHGFSPLDLAKSPAMAMQAQSG